MYKNETHSIYKQSNASLALLQMSVKALREVRCFYPPRLTFVYKSVIHPPPLTPYLIIRQGIRGRFVVPINIVYRQRPPTNN